MRLRRKGGNMKLTKEQRDRLQLKVDILVHKFHPAPVVPFNVQELADEMNLDGDIPRKQASEMINKAKKGYGY